MNNDIIDDIKDLDSIAIDNICYNMEFIEFLKMLDNEPAGTIMLYLYYRFIKINGMIIEDITSNKIYIKGLDY